MMHGKKIVVVMPAYNAVKTLPHVVSEIPDNIVDEIILVDDCSQDGTYELAKELGIKHIIRHNKNIGYGGNQKTCYEKALSLNADIVVMLHPDYQYPPKLIPALCEPIALNIYQVMLASRIIDNGALSGGMPFYKYISNRLLTFIQNLLMGQSLSEYHTGYRAFNADVLKAINLIANSNDFVFDNQMLAQIFAKGFHIGEIACPTKYFQEASSINFLRSLKYGFGVLGVSFSYFFNKLKICKSDYLN